MSETPGEGRVVQTGEESNDTKGKTKEDCFSEIVEDGRREGLTKIYVDRVQRTERRGRG
mgnify:CR=1 FL=1